MNFFLGQLRRPQSSFPKNFKSAFLTLIAPESPTFHLPMKTRIVRSLPLLALTAFLAQPSLRAQDTDGDLLSDSEELSIGTDPFDTDTDGDGILDRAEVYPFQIVPGTFTFQEALEDANAKGGRLAVIDSPQKLIEVKRGLLTGALPAPLPNNFDPTVTLANPLWVGAHDRLVDGRYQWIQPQNVLLTPTQVLSGPEIGSAIFGDLVPGSNQITNVVNINSLTVGNVVVASGIPSGTTITALDVPNRKVTLSNAVEGTLSRRISEIVVTNPGFGYTSTPTVTFSGGLPGISTITVVNQGTGYTTIPTVAITGGGGTGATAVATISAGKVTAITITNRGSGYTSAPTIAITGGGGAGATATSAIGSSPTAVATLTPDGKIKAITVTDEGEVFYTTAPTIAIIGGNGGGATATAQLTPAANASLASVIIDNAGAGYTSTPTVNLTGGGGTGASAVASINSLGQITGIAIVNPGSGFTFPPVVSFTGGQGVFSISLTNGGTGYATAPTVTLTGGGGTGATATATVSGGVVTAVTITNAGNNYTSAPTIAFTGGGGAGAAATATVTTPALATATIKVAAGRVYSPATDSYANWSANLPGNRVNNQEGVFLNTGTAFNWATATIDTTRGYLLELPATSPLNADTDGDGVQDDDELLVPTNPTLVDTDSDGLSDSAEAAGGSDPTLSDTDGDGLGDLQESVLGTNPTLTDTDGDGLSDSQEATFGSDPLLADSDSDGLTDDQEQLNGSDPNDADTDGDKLNDGDEVNTYLTDPTMKDTDGDTLNDRRELFTYNTNPSVADTDGDGLNDDKEISGDNTNNWTSDPLVVDTDGDLVSDSAEIGATPPTNPRDATSYPSGSVPNLTNRHTVPTLQTESNISIGDTFAPFGARPDTDKVGDDGSVAIRDRNGAIIWVNSEGVASVVPNSSQARTLYVSNTECVMYNNRYDGTYNARGSDSSIVIHRRQTADGTVLASSTITIANQTVVDTAPITPNTFGFTLVTGRAFDDGISESTERFQSGTTQAGTPIFDIRAVNQWDVLAYTMYRITWDAKLQTLGGGSISVPRGVGNISGTQVIASGSDGSFVFRNTVAKNFFRDLPNGGFWAVEEASYWTSFNLNSENIQRINLNTYPPVSDVGYVSNTRLLAEQPEVVQNGLDNNQQPIFDETGNYFIEDYRQRLSGVTNLANVFNLDPGDKILPATTYTRNGMPPYVYTINSTRDSIQLYRADANLNKIGAPVSLPGPVLSDASLVRNARDGSLLVKSEGNTGVLWLPATIDSVTSAVTGLGTARSLAKTTEGLPMFASSKECVVWMNSESAVDLANGGVVPNALISHFQLDGSNVVKTDLTPPMAGRYVAIPSVLTNDPDTEGWFVTTFEKTAARSAVVRTYRLELSGTADRDKDGLTDYEELELGTDPASPDTDSDGLEDGEEVYPYALVSGSYSWDEARIDALKRGGRLVVLDSKAKQNDLKRLLGTTIRTSGVNYWIGAHDRNYTIDGKLVKNEGTYRWVQRINDLVKIEGAVYAVNQVDLDGPVLKSPFNWQTLQPNNINDSDAAQILPNTQLTWSMGVGTTRQSYIIEYPTSNPRAAKSDTDGDGLSDGIERSIGSHPRKTDSDGDGVSDRKEYNRGMNALSSDTDNDGRSDSDELTPFDSPATNNVESWTSDPSIVDTDGDGFSDSREISANPPTNPRDPQSRPSGNTDEGDWADGVSPKGGSHAGVSLERDPIEVSIPAKFSPFGNRTNFNRFGDDGSAMLVDINGVLLWQNAAGRTLTVPNSEQAAPLIVSDTEAIVWRNAFADYENYAGKPVVSVAIYRANDDTGAIEAPVNVALQGKEIVPTAPITTTSEAYGIVTSEHGLTLDNAGTDDDTIFRIYRIAFSGEVQRVSQIEVYGTGPADTAAAWTIAIGHGSDGSMVFTQDGFDRFKPAAGIYVDQVWPVAPDDRFRRVFWVDTTRAGSTNVWQELANDSVGTNWVEASQVSRAVYTSRTRVIYERYFGGNPSLVEARRNLFSGALMNDGIQVGSSVPFSRLLQTSTQTVRGNDVWFYALSVDGSRVLTYRVTNSGVALVFEATVPAGIVLDETATVDKINPYDGSAIVTSDNIEKVIWVRNASTEPNNNAIAIPGSGQSKAVFVSENEAVLWENAGASVNPLGNLQDVSLVLYEPSEIFGVDPRRFDLSQWVEGKFVLDTRPFTPPDDFWLFSTVEKSGPTTATIRTYRLKEYRERDDDNDGLSDSAERNGFAIREVDGDWVVLERNKSYNRKPGDVLVKTDPKDPDSDNDGVNDGLELQPFRFIDDAGYTFEEARVDAISRGGRLAVPSRKEKSKRLESQFALSDISESLWIGGGDTDGPDDVSGQREGDFVWVNLAGRFFNSAGESVGVPFSYSNWNFGQPSNAGDADGVQVSKKIKVEASGSLSITYPWSTGKVDKKQGYVLEYPVSNPSEADTDGDGVNDGREIRDGTDPTDKDTDGDGLSDKREKAFGSDPTDKDTDNDGLSDGDEVKVHGTDPTKEDTDKDGLNDGDEVGAGTNPLRKDTDKDGLNDGDEIDGKTDPLKPDTDGDGLKDGREDTIGTNPTKADTDGDGIKDGDEVAKGSDPLDKDNPKNIDTDGDGLSDYEERFIYGTDPEKEDSDGDGLNDKQEINRGLDPNNTDTDGDGVSDYDEIYVTNTDPSVPSFGGSGPSGTSVPFSSTLVQGDYEGIVVGPKGGQSFKQSLRLSGSGSFTSKLRGLRSDASFKGTFSSKGSFVGKPGDAEGLKEVRMVVAKQDNGTYRIQGTYSTREGGTYYFELRKVSETAAKASSSTLRVTFEASVTGDVKGPRGSAIGTGSVSTKGNVSLSVYMPDGSRASFSGPTLVGNQVALFAKSSDTSKAVLVGSLKFRDEDSSDFDGSVRLFSAKGSSGTFFPSGYDQRREFLGSYYREAPAGTLPIKGFDVTSNNAVFAWRRGDFGPLDKVGTWASDGKVTIPTNQFDEASASFDRSTGLLSLTYVLTDSSKGLRAATSKAHAVVQQRANSFKGYYVSNGAAASFSVKPNKDGADPDVTSVSPGGKSVPAAETVYYVTVKTSGRWTVEIPSDVTWVKARISSADGPTGSSEDVAGRGDGQVRITVAQNTSFMRREAKIKIAGQTHNITQEFR